MREISLHILDIAQNSLTAGARHMALAVEALAHADTLRLLLEDDGCGMTPEQLAVAADPFFSTKQSRSTGLGLALLKQSAEAADGAFWLGSAVGVGTRLTAQWRLSHIDRPPMGDLAGTVCLLCLQEACALRFSARTDRGEFSLDTSQLRGLLGGLPLSQPTAAGWLRDYITEGLTKIHGGA